MRPDPSTVRTVVRQFAALRGPGPYDAPSMMEAALLVEDLLQIVLPDQQLTESNLGNAERLECFALRVLSE